VNRSERVLVTKNKDTKRAAVRSIDWLDRFRWLAISIHTSDRADGEDLHNDRNKRQSYRQNVASGKRELAAKL
jgi:hypothetical protein